MRALVRQMIADGRLVEKVPERSKRKGRKMFPGQPVAQPSRPRVAPAPLPTAAEADQLPVPEAPPMPPPDPLARQRGESERDHARRLYRLFADEGRLFELDLDVRRLAYPQHFGKTSRRIEVRR